MLIIIIILKQKLAKIHSHYIYFTIIITCFINDHRNNSLDLYFLFFINAAVIIHNLYNVWRSFSWSIFKFSTICFIFALFKILLLYKQKQNEYFQKKPLCYLKCRNVIELLINSNQKLLVLTTQEIRIFILLCFSHELKHRYDEFTGGTP